jgi:L-ribulose-5-phosphate 4-epimerase
MGPRDQSAIARVREQVPALHAQLTRYGLVMWTGGNVSGGAPGADLFVIKPSGAGYDDLLAQNMIRDLDGKVVASSPGSDRSPSSYRNMPEVGGMVMVEDVARTQAGDERR